MRGFDETGRNHLGSTRRGFLASTLAAGAALGLRRVEGAEGSKPPEMTISRTQERIAVKYGPRDLCSYQLTQPYGAGLTVSSACFFHPLVTPGGTVVTEIGPEDHRHHRGVFFGWVEMNGAQKADFWGWGEPAPTKGRKIVNRSVETSPPGLGYTRFRIVNEWQADGVKMVGEDLRAGVALLEGGTVLELTVQFSVEAPVTLARWGFGGLGVRLRKTAQIQAIGPAGPVNLPSPKHTDPSTNWPDAIWYGLHSKYSDGKQTTVAVVGRSNHPATTWHVVPSIGLINPSITAAGPVVLSPDKPLVLRYRIMAFDGPPKPAVIAKLAESWYHGRQ